MTVAKSLDEFDQCICCFVQIHSLNRQGVHRSENYLGSHIVSIIEAASTKPT